MNTITDRYGMTYAECLALQRDHVGLWHDKLKFDLICAVEGYLHATNKEATDSTQTHRVYRGQDLVQIIMDWPDLKPCYAPVEAKAEVVHHTPFQEKLLAAVDACVIDVRPPIDVSARTCDFAALEQRVVEHYRPQDSI